VHGDGLRHLKEADQLEPVQAMGARLVAMRVRKDTAASWAGDIDIGWNGSSVVDVRSPHAAMPGPTQPRSPPTRPSTRLHLR
jgi:hypothetical protein